MELLPMPPVPPPPPPPHVAHTSATRSITTIAAMAVGRAVGIFMILFLADDFEVQRDLHVRADDGAATFDQIVPLQAVVEAIDREGRRRHGPLFLRPLEDR